MNNISFDNPWLLLIAVPLLAAVIVPFAVTVRRDNANFHNVASVCLHGLICICIALAAAGTSLETVITETNVYVLADVSYSAEHNLDEVQDKVNAVSGKLPKNSKMGVICFGRNYQLISDMGKGVPDIKSADKVDRSATDIGSALRYAGNLFDDNVIKRIIVITDGAETVSSNNILKVVSSLQDNGVYVDAVYLDDNMSPEVREVQIDGVEATSSTYINKTEEAEVLVRANCGLNADGSVRERTEGYISLYYGDERIERVSAAIYNGLNVFSVPLPTDTAGSFAYRVQVETVSADDDTSPYNNSYLFTQKITDEKKVLFIGSSSADVAAGRGIYGDDGVTYVSEISDIPLSVADMCGYDEIAISNLDVRRIPASGMFLSSLSTLVNDYGKTLTTYGNTYIQEDNGDASNEPLRLYADLLPVKIGNYDQDARLYAIVLDISISMNFMSRFAAAKTAAVELIKVLNPSDMVMVVCFSGATTVLLPPTKLTATTAIINAINDCTAENETNISMALTNTYALMPSRYRDRNVILISDGIDSNPAAAKAVTEEMSRNSIAVSALGIYAQGTADSFLSEMINNPYAVSGSFYKNIANEKDLEFTIKGVGEETQNVRIEGGSYQVEIKSRADGCVDGIEDIESIGGFWYNSAKSTATTVLTAKYFRDKLTSFDVPVYAYWSGGGKGKVYSFLSDISYAADWTAGWIEGSGGRRFLSNVPEASLPEERIITPFVTEIESNGNSALLRVTSSSVNSANDRFNVTVTDPDGLVTNKNLSFDSSSYIAEFATDTPGVYTVHIEYDYKDSHYEADAEFSVSYYAEYDSFASYSRSYLYRLLTENGKILDLDEVTRLENSDSFYTSYVLSFTLPLMIACAVMFVADIIIRQLRWKDVESFFKGLFRRRK